MAEYSSYLLLQNGASLNGASYSKGSNGASNGTSANGVVLEADFTDSHSGNGKSKTLLDLRESEPVAVLNGASSARNGNGAAPVAVERTENGNGSGWADPCDVGQLEACAQERYAGVAASTLAGERCGVVLLGHVPPLAHPACASGRQMASRHHYSKPRLCFKSQS